MIKTTIVYDGVSGGAFNGGRYLANAISSKGGSVIVLPSNAELSTGDLAEIIASVIDGHEWTIGHNLRGKYTASNGCSFDDASLAVEISDVSFETLTDIAERLCRVLRLDRALLKDMVSGRIVLIMND
ncbi:MAG: hypothetical protein ACI4T9_10640 [Prevotella sp.]